MNRITSRTVCVEIHYLYKKRNNTTSIWQMLQVKSPEKEDSVLSLIDAFLFLFLSHVVLNYLKTLELRKKYL